jgi:hypothetical protein
MLLISRPAGVLANHKGALRRFRLSRLNVAAQFAADAGPICHPPRSVGPGATFSSDFNQAMDTEFFGYRAQATGSVRFLIISRAYAAIRQGQSLKMKCAAAPFFGSDIGDGLRKVPAMAVEVLSVVLALAIGLVLGFRQDDGTVLSRSLAVPLSIFDANLNDVRVVGYQVAFGDGEAAITGSHLDAVIGDA